MDAERIREALREHGLDCGIRYSVEDLERIKAARRARPQTSYPTYEGPELYFYVDIKEQDLLVVKELLLNMGFHVSARSAQEVVSDPEYLCPKCDFASNDPGLCPQHHETLLEYSEWFAIQRKNHDRRLGRVVLVIFLMALAFLGWVLIFTALHP